MSLRVSLTNLKAGVTEQVIRLGTSVVEISAALTAGVIATSNRYITLTANVVQGLFVRLEQDYCEASYFSEDYVGQYVVIT